MALSWPVIHNAWSSRCFGAVGVLLSLGRMRGAPFLQFLGIVSAAGATVFLVRDIRRSGRRKRLERALADYDDEGQEYDSKN